MSVPFILTEIALELLGNKFYNINGENRPDLKDIFASCTGQLEAADNSVQSSHLVSQLNLNELNLFNKTNRESIDHLTDQLKEALENCGSTFEGSFSQLSMFSIYFFFFPLFA